MCVRVCERMNCEFERTPPNISAKVIASQQTIKKYINEMPVNVFTHRGSTVQQSFLLFKWINWTNKQTKNRDTKRWNQENNLSTHSMKSNAIYWWSYTLKMKFRGIIIDCNFCMGTVKSLISCTVIFVRYFLLSTYAMYVLTSSRTPFFFAFYFVFFDLRSDGNKKKNP